MTVAEPSLVESTLADAHRRGWALVLAATVRVTRDLDCAEECVQEAYAAALAAWPRDGIPRNPVGWLTTTAKRRAIDVGRREQVLRSKLPLLVEPDEQAFLLGESPRAVGEEVIDLLVDERLRLIFLCCHPALSEEAQLALTLRLVSGIPTSDIAHALLVSEPTMSARLTRAKKKISTARIPFRLPAPSEIPARLGGVLSVIHLIFTLGHTAASGSSLVRADLVDESVHLARMLRELLPDEPEVRGLLALLIVTDARRSTRVADSGRLLRLAEQDRSRWDRPSITEAHGLIVGALRAGPPGRFTLQAAIASLHAQAPTFDQTDWPQIVQLYDVLLRVWPSPVVALNRAVAVAGVAGPRPALAVVEELERDGRLVSFQYLHAVKADLLERMGLAHEAAAAYRAAHDLARNEAERGFLAGRFAGSE